MSNAEDAWRGRRALDALGFDPNSVLAREPGVLLDRHFLGAMHAELEAELGSKGAATTLTQIGLIQGLHDAWRIVGDDLSETAVLPPALAMRFQGVVSGRVTGAIEVLGTWPERTEAGARLTLSGGCAHVACHLSAGYTSGWLSGTMEADILALETDCAATGAPECRFVAREAEIWHAEGDRRAMGLLADLPFDAIRELVQTRSPSSRSVSERVEPDSAVVHIWDSVMIIPFTDGDEALRALDLIAFDPAARNVSVVVVDLANAIIDEDFGATVLEQILETAESHGAETLFAAVSPLSEVIVAELDRQPLAVHKDLDQAIAMAFQIATAQQTTL